MFCLEAQSGKPAKSTDFFASAVTFSSCCYATGKAKQKYAFYCWSRAVHNRNKKLKFSVWCTQYSSLWRLKTISMIDRVQSVVNTTLLIEKELNLGGGINGWISGLSEVCCWKLTSDQMNSRFAFVEKFSGRDEMLPSLTSTNSLQQ